MLQDIRSNAQGTIAKIVVGLLILALSMWGIQAIVGGFSGEPEVATVNGQDITERDYNRAVQMEKQRRLGQMDTPDPSLLNEDQIRKQVLEGLIQQKVLTEAANEQGLALSDADLDQLIRQMSQFQVDGQFNRDRFVAVVRNAGMGLAQFREALRSQYVINQIRAGITASGFVSPLTAKSILQLQYQTRDFRTVSLDASLVADQVSVSDDDIQAYYDDHTDDFMVPETVDAKYIELSLADLAKQEDISEKALKDYYNTKAPAMVKEERKVSHILIEDGDKADEKLAEVQKKLANGEDFAKLAKEYSDDAASAKDGGNLGYAGRDVFDGAFEKAMFNLKVGEVSDPVRTPYGRHLIKVTDIRKTDAPSFDEMKDQLRDELAKDKASDKYAELRAKLADQAYSEGDLKGPAKSLGLTIKEQDGITRQGGPGPFQHAGLVRQLFSDDVLKDHYNTEVIDVGDDVSVVARVDQYHPAAEQPLEAVRDDIRKTLTRQRTQKALSARADQVIASLRDGQTLAELGLGKATWEEHKGVTRNEPKLGTPVLSQVFSMPRPADDGKPTYDQAVSGDSVTVVALDSVSEGKVEGNEQSLAQLQQFLSSQEGRREYSAYQQTLRERAEIEKP
ncbi:MAG: SurA N-terminal domain-containing protein [Marinobacter sp.]|nr:SurA N-terminal domain-containing protein [Marinobacter sp.]